MPRKFILTLKSLTCIVLELPNIYTRPSAAILLETLDALAIKPSTFDGSGHEYVDKLNGIGFGDGIPRYLTTIVSNPLEWVGDESLREKIWEIASARLSERCGRTGMTYLPTTRYILAMRSAF